MKVSLLSKPAPENLSENLFHAFTSLLGVLKAGCSQNETFLIKILIDSSMIVAVNI